MLNKPDVNDHDIALLFNRTYKVLNSLHKADSEYAACDAPLLYCLGAGYDVRSEAAENGGRAMIMGMDTEAGYQKLQAKIPLKELSNYSVALSSLTGGRASFTAKFASYELVPNDLQQKLIAEHEKETAEDE